MDRKERESNFIRLANWIWGISSVIPGDQQEGISKLYNFFYQIELYQFETLFAQCNIHQNT